MQNGQAATIQYQTTDGTILKTPKVEGQKAQDFPAFYTTSNVRFFLSFMSLNGLVFNLEKCLGNSIEGLYEISFTGKFHKT